MAPSTKRRLYERVSRILLSESLEHDCQERVGLLTVIERMRPVALFLDIEESAGLQLGRLLRGYGLISIITRGPVVAYTWESPYPPEITTLFRAPLKSRGLWVCRDREHAAAIKKGIDQPTAGRLLGYPECCIDAQQCEKARFEIAVIDAYIRSFDGDPHRIAQALEEDRKVPTEWEPGDRVPRTFARFPFVQHIACETCLVSQRGPTAVLNSQYQDLVAEADPTLHDYLLRFAADVEESVRRGPRSSASSVGPVI